MRKNHALLTELHFDVFPDHGNLGPWKSEKPYCWVPSFHRLGKINKNAIWTYEVDYPLDGKVQANTFKNQGAIHVLPFLSSSKTLTSSNLYQIGCSKLHWSH